MGKTKSYHLVYYGTTARWTCIAINQAEFHGMGYLFGALSIHCFGCVSIEEGGSHFYLKRTGYPELEANSSYETGSGPRPANDPHVGVLEYSIYPLVMPDIAMVKPWP